MLMTTLPVLPWLHQAGAIFVLDCVASGALYVDMAGLGVDVLLTAQKGWTASPCAGVIMLGAGGIDRIEKTTSTSYAADLKKWLSIMQTYENGGHAIMLPCQPTGCACFVMRFMKQGISAFALVKQAQIDLGVRMRALTDLMALFLLRQKALKPRL